MSQKPCRWPLLLIVGACFISAGAQAANWTQAARGDAATYFVDTDSVQRDGTYLIARVRIEFVDMQISPAGIGYINSESRRRVDCRGRQMVVLEQTLYDGRGRVLSTDKPSEAKWLVAKPDTAAEAILQTICTRTASAQPDRPRGQTPAATSDGLTLISKDDEDSWHLVDDSVKFTGTRFLAVVFQVYAKPVRDDVSKKQMAAVGWRVEGNCADSVFGITLKQAFDEQFEAIRELPLSASEERVRQYPERTIAFRVLKAVCATKGLNVVAAASSGSASSSTPAAEPPARSSRFSGSGFAVTATGRFVTNDHVVKECAKLWVSTPGSVKSVARVTARDERNDLALVDAQVATPVFASFRSTPVLAGESVVALGFPLKGLLATEVNVSTGTVSALAGISNDTTKLQLSAPIQPGNSGGPLLDASGSVAAVVVEKLDALSIAKATGSLPEGISFGIKTDVVLLFLRSAGVEPRLDPPGLPRLEAAEIAKRGKPMTYLLECESAR